MERGGVGQSARGDRRAPPAATIARACAVSACKATGAILTEGHCRPCAAPAGEHVPRRYAISHISPSHRRHKCERATDPALAARCHHGHARTSHGRCDVRSRGAPQPARHATRHGAATTRAVHRCDADYPTRTKLGHPFRAQGLATHHHLPRTTTTHYPPTAHHT